MLQESICFYNNIKGGKAMKNVTIEKALEIKLEHTCCYSGSCYTCYYFRTTSGGDPWCDKDNARVREPEREKECHY